MTLVSSISNEVMYYVVSIIDISYYLYFAIRKFYLFWSFHICLLLCNTPEITCITVKQITNTNESDNDSAYDSDESNTDNSDGDTIIMDDIPDEYVEVFYKIIILKASIINNDDSVYTIRSMMEHVIDKDMCSISLALLKEHFPNGKYFVLSYFDSLNFSNKSKVIDLDSRVDMLTLKKCEFGRLKL